VALGRPERVSEATPAAEGDVASLPSPPSEPAEPDPIPDFEFDQSLPDDFDL
jgi:hypothetical protein